VSSPLRIKCVCHCTLELENPPSESLFRSTCLYFNMMLRVQEKHIKLAFPPAVKRIYYLHKGKSERIVTNFLRSLPQVLLLFVTYFSRFKST
jgi:hypothetical protein